ncbi:hypothetical protein AURDEDRAFT_179971 [Auricularia subglabra TFB-10046 SS5]|nr:hypothetical protein AURDEDRAFT_179971 [Auricularia subglabra TFB-10046 SS5]
MLLDRRQKCIATDSCVQPQCNCRADETCSFTPITCEQCPLAKCTPIATSKAKGPSTGTLAGAVIGVVMFAVLCALAFFWWRRRTAGQGAPSERGLKAIAKAKDVPANPDAVLSRPDPQEKHYSTAPTVATTMPPPSLAVSDPFSDHASIQTASARTHSPNVITIGLIPPPDSLQPMPRRPERAPDLVLRAPEPYEPNQLHPPTARFAKRNSTGTAITEASVASSAFSTASSTMDILSETPQIVSPAVRQVLGISKAEVVHVSNGSAASSPTSTLHPIKTSRSPLAQSSFTPEDVKDDGNPFDDENLGNDSSASSIRSTSTFGQRTPTQQWTFPPSPAYPDSRPTSMQSTAGTIIAQVGSATRVVFGVQSPHMASASAPAPPQPAPIATSGTLLAVPGGRIGSSPPSPKGHDDDDDDSVRRMSHASEISVASSRAESLLDAFPFVPPSPIAARPPRSPLGVTFTPPSPAKSAQSFAATQQQQQQTSSQRNVRGLSTMSASSGMSGLGDYTFKFPGPADGEAPPLPQNTKRASLDTIALSRDVEAFPLSSYDDPLHPGRPDSFAASGKS